MVGIALAITLAATAAVMITIIITESRKDIARLQYQHNIDTVATTTELARLQASLVAVQEQLEVLDPSKIKDLKLDVTQLKMQAGL